jgi:hypothetical protein
MLELVLAALVAAQPSAPQPLLRGSVVPSSASARRNLADKLSDTLSVLDFGATGNGKADDTAALNRAGASGRRVLVPPGTYRVAATGAGGVYATVQLSAGTVFYAADPRKSVLAFSGTPEPASTAAVRLDGAGAGVEQLGISITAGAYGRGVNHRADDTFTRRCRISVSTSDLATSVSHYAVFATIGTPLYGIVIEGNDIVRTNVPKGDGVQVAQAPGVRVVGNVVRDSTLSQELADCSGQKCGQQSWGIYVSSGCPGAEVFFNTVASSNHSGIHFNESGTVSANVGRRMVGNYVHDVKYVCASVDYATGAVVQGNWFSRCDIPLNIIASVDTVVTGNHFEDVVNVTPPGDSSQPMLAVSTTSPRTLVTGNTFGKRGTALSAVVVNAPDVTLAANVFGSDRPRSVLVSTSTATGLRFSQNKVATTTDVTAGQYIVSLNGDNSVADGNDITLEATIGGAIRLGATNQVARGNRILGGAGGVYAPSAATTNALIEANVITGATTALVDSGTATVKRRNVVGGKPSQASGKSQFNGTGAQTAFVIPHGLLAAPTSVVVTPGSAAANGLHYVSADATNITVTYAAAPASGTNNVVVNWAAESN